MARDCMKLYLEEKKKVGVLLRGNVGRICLTTDTWTSLQRINYMCLTAHYIDNDWVLRKKVLNFCPISSHRGVDIGKAVEMCLLKWGIESNVFTITVDNATANDVAVAYLKNKFANWEKSVLEGKWLHVRCTAHVMNLIVQDGLSHIGKSVDCVRAAVKYIRQSPQRLVKFKEYAEIEKCPSKKGLILDVQTRWNSTYLMLEIAHNYERAFARYDSEDRHYRDDLEKTGVPVSSDWANVRRLTKFLEHFYELTLKVSGTLYVTSNSFLDDITSIEAALNNCINGGSPDKNLAAMAKMMKCKFDKYYRRLEKCNMATVVASVLDPRNKFEYVEVLSGDVYGKIEGKAMCAMRKASLVELYEDYVRIHASPETHTMFESIDASSSMNKRSATPVIEPSVILKQKVRMEMKRRKSESGMHDSKSELDSPRFPVLSLLARDVLVIPISTVASESVFSTGGRVLDAFRSSLTPPVVESLICTQDWFRENSMGLDVAENWDEIQKIEEVADFTNLEPVVNVSPIPTSRINSIHPSTFILGDPQSAVQTRSKVTKSSRAHAFKISEALEDESWVDAMQEELQQFKIQKVWILVDLHYGKKAIGTKWVYRNKKDERGVVVRNKARLVAQGHRQEEGVDYDEFFAPVARIEAIRIFLAFASYMGSIVYQMDMKSAFLYGKIDEEVYVSQPPGFIDPKSPQKVDYEILNKKYPIIEWKSEYLGTKLQFDETKRLEEINLNVVIRSNGQKRYFSTLMRVLSIFDREDINAVYKLVIDRYQDEIP
ncbi:zinc finger BED domain-containing protein RICESLEEPER 2-like protein, partial [Tanacetum coccineum]